MNDKYKMFKNFLHNELQLTKEDIQEWIREVIKEEVKNVVQQAYGKCDIKDIINKEVGEVLEQNDWGRSPKLKEEIKDRAIKQMTKNFEITIKEKK